MARPVSPGYHYFPRCMLHIDPWLALGLPAALTSTVRGADEPAPIDMLLPTMTLAHPPSRQQSEKVLSAVMRTPIPLSGKWESSEWQLHL